MRRGRGRIRTSVRSVKRRMKRLKRFLRLVRGGFH